MLGRGDAFYCPMLKSKRAIVIQLSKEDGDTIIGYDCEYPNCPYNGCQLIDKYPIGTSSFEIDKKNMSNT